MKKSWAVVKTSQDIDIDSRNFANGILLGSLIAMILWLAVIIMIMAS